MSRRVHYRAGGSKRFRGGVAVLLWLCRLLQRGHRRAARVDEDDYIADALDQWNAAVGNDWGGAPVPTDDVREAVLRAADALREAGAVVEPTELFKSL